jgi:hypothetical protein
MFQKSLLKFIICSCLLLSATFTARAQYNEFGIFLGTSRYKGELSPHMFTTQHMHFAIGGFYRHNWTRHWGWKLEVNYGAISGDDLDLNTGFEQSRGLNFYSTILEASPQIEFNFLPYETGNSDFGFTPYILIGLSVFHFNPRSQINGDVELQPLGTEGQGLAGREDFYGRTVIAIPIGGGLKISAGGAFAIGIEVAARRTYTDYLDDVSTTYPDFTALETARGKEAVFYSDPAALRDDGLPYKIFEGKQRGNPNDNDWYLFTGITFSVRVTSFMRDFCRPFKYRRY